MHANEQAQTPGGKRPARTPVSARAQGGGVPMGLLALQATAGNAAVVQMLRAAGHPWAQEQHQHNAGCGHGTEQPAVQRSAVHDVLRTGGRPLDDATRTDMESRLGADFSDVRIHNDSAAKASAAEVGARAYTSGSHIVIGDGGGDKHTLAHELTHVIQQRQGPVAGTDNGRGLKVSDPSDRFEREAEANATRVMRSSASPMPRTGSSSSKAPEPAGMVQRAPTVRKTRLLTQVGPSCWLYVLEAMAQAHGLDTTALNAAMRAFPGKQQRDGRAGEEIEKRKKSGKSAKVDTRMVGVVMMLENLKEIKKRVAEFPGEDKESIGEEELCIIFQEVTKAGKPASMAYAKTICDAGQAVKRSDVDALFDKAIDRAKIIGKHVAAEGDEVSNILASGQQAIYGYPEGASDDDRKEILQDAGYAMDQVNDLPQYLTIKKRFGGRSLTQQQLEEHHADVMQHRQTAEGKAGVAMVVDWTNRDLQTSSHAVLLTNHYEENGVRYVHFKDANFASTEIKVTLAKFIEMAGTDKQSLTMRPYLPGKNGNLSPLEKLAG